MYEDFREKFSILNGMLQEKRMLTRQDFQKKSVHFTRQQMFAVLLSLITSSLPTIIARPGGIEDNTFLTGIHIYISCCQFNSSLTKAV